MRIQTSTTSQRTTDRKTIWVFTPSRTDPKDLEFILVQRQKLIEDAVERVKESALTDHKHPLLFVGPRGCGKTHLITVANPLNRAISHGPSSQFQSPGFESTQARDRKEPL